jgi:hypothetical protein
MSAAPTVADRAKAIRAATPDVLENLFEMQNRICDLCEQPIQDLILAALDHSRPVIIFARDLSLPIGEAIRWANALGNLRAVHANCNHVKKDKTKEEWFALGLDKEIGKPRIYTEGELLEFQFRLGAGGRKTAERLGPEGLSARGRVGLRAAVSRGTPEERTAAMRKFNASLTPEERSEKSRKAQMKVSPEQRAERSRKSGIASAAATAAMTPEERSARAHKAGAASAAYTASLSPKERLEKYRKAAASISPEAKEARSATGRKIMTAVAHNRWHVARGVVNPNCLLCRAAA